MQVDSQRFMKTLLFCVCPSKRTNVECGVSEVWGKLSVFNFGLFIAMATRILTGITTSGTPHLGNYAGAIRPAIAASLKPDTESFYFLADYHALIKTADPARVQRSTLEIAAAWLAAGLNPGKVWFYRQSDIPQIPELTWLLTCVASKGLLNRAHAYKAAVDINTANRDDEDAGISAGLFMYPVLMAADIVMFGANKVPVGRDQIQHIEMARDFAARFNHLYGEHLVLPEAVIEESVATLPGLDGRKMSKSYDNTIPLFSSAAELKKAITSIVTDSRLPGEPKDPDSAHLFSLYQAFSSFEQSQNFRQALLDGLSWGEAKQALFETIDAQISPMREKYTVLMAKPELIEQQLQQGAEKARAVAAPLMKILRHAVGLRNLSSVAAVQKVSDTKVVLPLFKQYRESDGKFYFKLLDADGELLLQSMAFDTPKDAGAYIANLKSDVQAIDSSVKMGSGISSEKVQLALTALRLAAKEK
jgi:tryptophanyl-tRNA synthetase